MPKTTEEKLAYAIEFIKNIEANITDVYVEHVDEYETELCDVKVLEDWKDKAWHVLADLA